MSSLDVVQPRSLERRYLVHVYAVDVTLHPREQDDHLLRGIITVQPRYGEQFATAT